MIVMMQTQTDTATRVLLDWNSVNPGDQCPTGIDDEINRDCPFSWAVRVGNNTMIAACTRPRDGHEGGQHVAEGETEVLAVSPWQK